MFEHKWTFHTQLNAAREELTTRFGLVQLGDFSSRLPPPLEAGGEAQAGWQTCSDLAALARSSYVLFLAGFGTDATWVREAIAPPAHGFVVDLRAALADADEQATATRGLHHLAVSDFIRVYVQQVVAFDLEDARAALGGQAACQVTVSVAAGDKSATTAALAAAREVRRPTQTSSTQGQAVLLTFGSRRGCLQESKEAFNACRAGLPHGAVCVQAVGIDARLPPGTVRATVFTSYRWTPAARGGPVVRAT